MKTNEQRIQHIIKYNHQVKVNVRQSSTVALFVVAAAICITTSTFNNQSCLECYNQADMTEVFSNETHNSPVERVLNFSVHDHCLKHGTFTNDKLNHTMYRIQQWPNSTHTCIHTY